MKERERERTKKAGGSKKRAKKVMFYTLFDCQLGDTRGFKDRDKVC
jgi:hypothetical protein